MRLKMIMPVVAMCLMTVVNARGGAVDTAIVPADAKWVIHIDADAVRDSRIWQSIQPRLAVRPDYNQFVQAARLYAGSEMPKDMHGVTLYGLEFGENAAVVVIDATVDQALLTDTLRFAAVEVPKTQGAREVFSWNDEKGDHYGAFAGGRFVIANSEKMMHDALDVIGAQKAPMSKLPGPVAAEKAAVMLYVNSADMSGNPALAQTPFAQNVKGVWMAVSSAGDSLTGSGEVSMTDPTVAKQANDMLNGLKAFALMSVNDPKHDEVARKAMATLSGLTSTVEGSAVKLDWTVPMKTVEELIQAAEAKKAEGLEE